VVILVRNPIAGANVNIATFVSLYERQKNVERKRGSSTSTRSVRVAAGVVLRTFERIDGLVCCAGIGPQTTYYPTIDGYESTIQINCLAHALLSTVLAEKLTKGVVIHVSSHAALDTTPFDYAKPFLTNEIFDGLEVYSRSMLMINVFTKMAAEKCSPGL
ncbi:hypothetical protein PMAYCL1PPCAC_27035, partial [Pristionchus mayeri]